MRTLLSRLFRAPPPVEPETIPLVGEMWIQLHVGDPGPTCTENLAKTADRRLVEFKDGANINEPRWFIVNEERFTHVSLWTDRMGGIALGPFDLNWTKSVRPKDQFSFPPGAIYTSYI